MRPDHPDGADHRRGAFASRRWRFGMKTGTGKVPATLGTRIEPTPVRSTDVARENNLIEALAGANEGKHGHGSQRRKIARRRQ
jgi:hypothetical protein